MKTSTPVFNETAKKYQIYNSMFLNLSYQDSNQIGHLIPLLARYAKQGLDKGHSPKTILEGFLDAQKDIIGSDSISFLFRVIQYVERQVVLFDSIEDATSPYNLEDNNVLLVKHFFTGHNNTEDRVAILQKLNDFSVRVVLTAHPTQFYRPPVLDIIAELREEIRKSNVENIDDLLHQLGLTSLVNVDSPTPLDEARNILHICRYYYYDAIGQLYRELEASIKGFDNPNLLGLGFWPCGDRDGNPYVNHQTTLDVIDDLRMTLMKCYYNDLKQLSSKLTFREVEKHLAPLRLEVYQAMFDRNKILNPSIFIDTLKNIRAVTVAKYESLYLDKIDELIAKCRIFGVHFACLDIRQDHSVHLQTIEWLLKKNGYVKNSISELSADKLIDILLHHEITLPEKCEDNPLVDDTIQKRKATKRTAA